MAVTGTISSSIAVNDNQTAGLGTINAGILNKIWAITIADGTGAGQGNKIFQKIQTVSGGGSDDFDLAGTLENIVGTAVSMTRVIAWGIRNLSTTNTLTIGNGTNPWATCLSSTGTITLRPTTSTNSSFCLFSAPDATAYAITAGTGDVLKVAGTAGQTYEIFVIGS